jgi:hypothetical protein
MPCPAWLEMQRWLLTHILAHVFLVSRNDDLPQGCGLL